MLMNIFFLRVSLGIVLAVRLTTSLFAKLDPMSHVHPDGQVTKFTSHLKYGEKESRCLGEVHCLKSADRKKNENCLWGVKLKRVVKIEENWCLRLERYSNSTHTSSGVLKPNHS